MKTAESANVSEAVRPASSPDSEILYRMLPAVHELLAKQVSRSVTLHERERCAQAVRRILSKVRAEIAQNIHSEKTLRIAIDQFPEALEAEMQRTTLYSLRRVINATGVILHTNLGRAPLSRRAAENVSRIAAGYSNLEFDLEGGQRGRRDDHVRNHLLALIGESTGQDLSATHGTIAVNNCAAATFLALHALARGRQVIASRSELVEIGGGFRIPEILEQSGAILREVGTTNRTRVADYERAIGSETGLILRVHQSNFAMDGFVERPGIEELVQLGKRTGIPVLEDQGTGLIQDLEPYGIHAEPTLTASVAAGVDVVTASGDKLFGGPQCGILVGHRELIESMRKDPLYRAFRIDKLSYAALEATLIDYLRGDRQALPILRMLHTSEAKIRHRCEQVLARVQSNVLTASLAPVESIVGGGTAPRCRLPSYAIALRHEYLSVEVLLARLRRSEIPIIARTENDRVLIDLRTVEPEVDACLASLLELAGKSEDAPDATDG